MQSNQYIFSDVSGSTFLRFCQSLKTSVSDLVKILELVYSGNNTYYVLEKAVFRFIERYVEGLDMEMAAKFCKYATGLEVMPKSVKVIFNGVTNVEMMAPIAHVCANTIEIDAYQDENIMNRCLYVEFVGESGKDIRGVTRGFFLILAGVFADLQLRKRSIVPKIKSSKSKFKDV